MISPDLWKAYGESVVAIIPELSEFIPVTEEAHLGKALKGIGNKPVLVLIDLSSDGRGANRDAYQELHQAQAFVLSKSLSPQNSSPVKEHEIKVLHHGIAEKVKALIISNTDGYGQPCNFFRNLNINSIHTDPVYNYLGCNGYFISFEF